MVLDVCKTTDFVLNKIQWIKPDTFGNETRGTETRSVEHHCEHNGSTSTSVRLNATFLNGNKMFLDSEVHNHNEHHLQYELEDLVFASNWKLFQILKSLLIYKKSSIVENWYTVNHANCIYRVSWIELQLRQSQGHVQIASRCLLRTNTFLCVSRPTNPAQYVARRPGMNGNSLAVVRQTWWTSRGRNMGFLPMYSVTAYWYHKCMWPATTAATLPYCREDYSRSAPRLTSLAWVTLPGAEFPPE